MYRAAEEVPAEAVEAEPESADPVRCPKTVRRGTEAWWRRLLGR